MRRLVYLGLNVFALWGLYRLARMVAVGAWQFPALFAGLYLTILLLTSRWIWKPYHDAYPARGAIDGVTYVLVAFYSGIGKGLVNVRVGQAGLRLAVPWMLRPFYPPVHFPWSDIQLTYPGRNRTRICFKDDRLADMILDKAIPIEPSEETQPADCSARC